MSKKTNTQFALAYAALGWPVFPIHRTKGRRCSCGKGDCESPGKHPRTPHGLKDATTDQGRIQDWWNQWPMANLAILTGSPSNLVGLDVDISKGGEKTLGQLEQQHGALPLTVEQCTGGGGRHLLFAYPGNSGVIRNSVGKLGPGLDIRGEGGYILAPPSIHQSGQRYEWVKSRSPFECSPVPLPDWLLRLIQQGSTDGGRTENASESIPKGQRNSTLTSYAGTMWHRRMSREAILAALKKENQRRCEEPLPDEEVERIVESVCRYPNGAQEKQGSRPKIYTASELMAEKFPERREVVETLMAVGVTLVAGKPKMGKSWLALNIGCAVASGEPLFGTHATTQGDVLYVGLEDSFPRLQTRLGLMTTSPPPNLHLVTDLPRLDQGATVILEEWVKRCPNPCLIIVDTLARVRPNTRKNSNIYQDDTNVGGLLQKFAYKHGIAILIIHHLNKLQKVDDPLDAVSGTLGLTGAVDAVWILTRKRHELSGCLQVTGRDTEEQMLNLAFDPETGSWDFLNMGLKVNLRPARREVVECLQKAEWPLTPKEIAQRLGKTPESIRKLLGKMLVDGEVTKDDQSRYSPVTPSTEMGGDSNHSDHSSHPSHSGHSDHP